MNNSVLSAKNTFLEGLIMDFSPDNTSAQSLTSALNATLITLNGNEMALLNDMGNGRVETAFLPEGFIPVGTCEFGDIIYIVSYNPLTNKSLIGCFPSPERNISTEEIGNLDITLSSDDFQETNEFGELTGVLKASSCKKILYEKSLNPGDKYIIYSKNDGFNKNNIGIDNFTDYGNTSHIYGTFPKLIKIHVVAIEDSNKINFLDTTVKWYSSENSKDYIIQNSYNYETNRPGLDSYRNLVSSNYSIFQSKVSGKLALLIELEKITGFSCTTDIYSSESDITTTVDNSTISGKKYDIYWNINWTSNDNNINPKYVVLTKSLWVGKELKNYGKWFYYKKINNEYKIDYSDSFNYSKPIDLDNYLENNINSFRNIEGELLSSYWYTLISRLYEPENYTGTYESFLNSEGYYPKEKAFIEQIKNGYSGAYTDLNINKLNIARTDNGLPIINSEGLTTKGSYYINAHHLDDEGIYYTSLANGSYINIPQILISDDIVNNYFKSSIYKKFHSFNIPTTLTFSEENIKLNLDISNLIYKYALTPAMPYGLLEEFTLEGYIDFSKIGTGEIKLTNWRYYNTENISTLTLGLEAYPEPNKGISEIVIDFYDNLGIAASYHISNKNSYSGIFTEYIPLNGITSNYKLNVINSKGDEILHLGTKPDINNNTNLVYKSLSGKIYKVFKEDDEYKYIDNYLQIITILDVDNIYTNDAGILYSNIVYLASIVVKYCSKNSLGEYNDNTSEYKVFNRWFWTNNMFNNYYYSSIDFENILATLDLDIYAEYKSKDNWKCDIITYERSDLQQNNDLDNYLNLSTIVLSINQNGELDEEGNFLSKITIGLLNTFNTFSLAKSVEGTNMLNNFNLKITLGKSCIENSPEIPDLLNTENIIFNKFLGIYPIYDKDPIPNYVGILDKYGYLDETKISKTLFKKLDILDKGIDEEIWSNSKNYENYKNIYSLNFANKLNSNINLITSDAYKYLNESGDLITLDKYIQYLSSIDLIYDSNIDLTFTGIHFSKKNRECYPKKVLLPTLTPLINNTKDLLDYGMVLYDNHAYFVNLVTLNGRTNSKQNSSEIEFSYFLNSTENTFKASECIFHKVVKVDEKQKNWAFTKNCTYDYKMWNYEIKDLEGVKYFKDLFSKNIGLIGYTSTGKDGGSDTYLYIKRVLEWVSRPSAGLPIVYNPLTNPKWDLVFGSSVIKVPTDILNNDNGSNATELIIGLVMKDINGDIHLLGDLFKVPFSGLLAYQTLNYNILGEKLLTIGDAVLSTLSNIYVLNNLLTQIEVNNINNIYYLKDNSSTFSKDIIYELKSDKNSEVILLLGIQLSSYIEKVKNAANNPDILDYNVDIKLNSILKNIPININFNYITSLLENVDLNLYSAVIRYSDTDSYTPIIGNFMEKLLYTFDNINDTINHVNSGVYVREIKDITVSETGNIIYSYLDFNPLLYSYFSNYFTLDDSNNLIVLNESFSDSLMMGIHTAIYEDRHNLCYTKIGGITKEHITLKGQFLKD